jgi:hypothetical protein
MLVITRDESDRADELRREVGEATPAINPDDVDWIDSEDPFGILGLIGVEKIVWGGESGVDRPREA